MYQIVAQALGYAAMALCVLCFQCKSSRSLIVMQTVGNFLFLLHFLMLGAYSGCASQIICVTNNILICVKNSRWAQWLGWKWVLSAAAIVACYFTWSDWFSILPCIAGVLLIQFNWTRNNTLMRIGKLTIIGPGWLIYNLHVHSYSATICEMIGITSALVSLIRYKKSGGKQA